MRNSLFMLGIALLVGLFGCNFDSIYEKSEDIPKEEWNKNEVIKFEIPVTDTIHGYRIFVNVRNSNEYPYSNLFLFLTTYSPQGKSVKDTLEMTLADDRGKWLGSGFGGIWSSETALRNNTVIRFPSSGIYRIEVVQAMRDDVLRGIKDIGIKVERAK
ncbi:MAG TPA: gliding motility lipoprotein GldH [Bacteroidales bacterium]